MGKVYRRGANWRIVKILENDYISYWGNYRVKKKTIVVNRKWLETSVLNGGAGCSQINKAPARRVRNMKATTV